MEIKGYLWAVVAGFLLDLVLGDPYCLPHPVRWIGNLIARLEKSIRKHLSQSKGSLLLGGVLLVLLVLLTTGLFSFFCLESALRVHPFLGWMVAVVMNYYLLAARSLRDESMKVYEALKKGSLEDGRKAVSMIVGRDTASLDQVGVIKAAVETVAENTSDGVVAPLFYMVLGGPVLGFLYKAVNTMDSMVGYRNETYEYFGKAAARLDDLVNWLPARISAWLMIGASLLPGFSTKQAVKIYRRDRRCHKSLNSAHTEAVCAGALKVQLAGDAWYFGKLVKKPFIGDPIREVVREDIPKANVLMYGTSLLALVFLIIVRWRIEF